MSKLTKLTPKRPHSYHFVPLKQRIHRGKKHQKAAPRCSVPLDPLDPFDPSYPSLATLDPSAGCTATRYGGRSKGRGSTVRFTVFVVEKPSKMKI